jgi:hypothetical protein
MRFRVVELRERLLGFHQYRGTTNTRFGGERPEATMAWTNDHDVRWETGETELTMARVIYWLATIIAALMFVFVVGDFFISWAQGAPIVRVFALGAAALVWLIGRALRALLS